MFEWKRDTGQSNRQQKHGYKLTRQTVQEILNFNVSRFFFVHLLVNQLPPTNYLLTYLSTHTIDESNLIKSN